MLAFTVLMMALVNLLPQPDRPVAAIFPPWWQSERSGVTAAAIGLPILRWGALPAIVVLQPDPGMTTADLVRRARRAGAWLVVNARVFGGCTVDPRQTFP